MTDGTLAFFENYRIRRQFDAIKDVRPDLFRPYRPCMADYCFTVGKMLPGSRKVAVVEP